MPIRAGCGGCSCGRARRTAGGGVPRPWRCCAEPTKGLFWDEVQQITSVLLEDEDDMVRKGLAWLLRETARFDGARTLPLLMSIRQRAPRLVLRTACERLSAEDRARVLAR